jgi:hypothetical protein
MTKLEDIEKAVASLAAEQLAEFRAWFAEFEADRFDADIERGARAGKLDGFAEQAVRDFREGRTKDI